MALAQRAPQKGALLRGYRLLAPVGSGPHGQVFHARDEARGREVALKLFHAHQVTPAALTRHAELARAAAAVPRSSACAIVELVPDGPSPLLAMEWIGGVDLAQLLRQTGPLPWVHGQALLLRCAAALAAAHRAGVSHTALKPGNIRVVGDPARATVRLLDFGGGALIDRRDSGATRVHDDLSADYVAPEELRGEAPGPAADLYRLGVLFFELLTGHRPFEGRVQEVVRHHQRTRPPPPRSLAPTLPPEADELLLALLEKLPARRPGAEDLRARLAPAPPPRRARDEEAPTAMWSRPPATPAGPITQPHPDSASDEETTGTHTVVLLHPSHLPPVNPGEVTLVPEGMGGEFLYAHLPPEQRPSEQTSVLTNTSATVFVDRSRLPASTPTVSATPAWRRRLAGPWSFERKLLTINVAFGVLILLGLLLLARGG